MPVIDALDFDADERLSWGNLAFLQDVRTTDTFSLLAFVRFDNITQQQPMYSKRNSSGNERFTFFVRGDLNDRFALWSNQTEILIASSDELAAANLWGVCSFRCDGTNLNLNLQDASDGTAMSGAGNGYIFNSAALSTGAAHADAPLLFGAHLDGSGYDFAGRACLFCGINGFISNAEFDTYRQDPLNTVQGWLSTKDVQFWHPDTSVYNGTTLTDSSGNGNHATGSVTNVVGGGPDVPALSVPTSKAKRIFFMGLG